MEIAQVEAFLAVGTFGGFRRAADALRVTQPAISARIKALEDSLGVSLFDRAHTGLALSPAGRALRPHAEQLLRAVALARQAVHDLRPSNGGAITIAAALSICTYLLPDVLKRFQTAHPKTLITVRSGHSKEVLGMVLAGEAELGLARSLHHPEIETVSLRDDPLVLVSAPAGAMARAGAGPARGGGRPAADPVRPRLQRLDAVPRALPPGGAGAQRGARGRVDRGGQADGGAGDRAGLPAPDRGAARDPPRSGCAPSRSATPSRSAAASTSSIRASAR